MLAPGLDVLDERERLIIHLRFWEGLTQSQIAAQVGISQMHVSRLIRRALEKVREEIATGQKLTRARAYSRPMRTSDELREGFLSFFESKGHLRRPSASLVPATTTRPCSQSRRACNL